MAKDKTVMKAQAVKMKGETVEKLKNLHIEMGGVVFDTYDAKVNHLMWFFENYKKSKPVEQ